MKNSNKFVIFSLILSSLLFTGCGDSSSSPTTSSVYTSPRDTLDDVTDTIDTDITSDLQVCSSIPVKNVLGSSQSLNDSNDLSKGLLNTSENLLNLSKSLIDAGDSANTQYIEAMLALSNDILEMADKIGEMADRILIMSDDIGEMSERILQTKKIQSDNLAMTQENILQAQKNFNKILD